MGGRRLKRLVRMHARRGNTNSFIADFESRLDRVLYRCNAVPSIFAARMAVGHKHVMVNGRVCNSTHRLLDPGDIIEPAPGSRPLFERLSRRRLANNATVTRLFPAREGEGPAPAAVADARGARDAAATVRRAQPAAAGPAAGGVAGGIFT